MIGGGVDSLKMNGFLIEPNLVNASLGVGRSGVPFWA
jgi:hypothetical protein